jgi:acetyl esterase
MPLDPQARLLLDQMASMGTPPLHTMSVPDARSMMESLNALLGQGEEVAHVEDRDIPGPPGRIPTRLYRPEGSGPLPLLVYFHGGGWVLGGLASHDVVCRSLANASGCAVLAIDYRLAPEHTFPAAVDDCYAAASWAVANAKSLGADPARVAVGGDSAGGNLAAVMALLARDRHGPRLLLQVLIYPVTNHDFGTVSYRENATGFVLGTEDMRWFWRHYLTREEQGREPLASPLLAKSLADLPTALVVTAGCDPLRDEGEAYAVRLRDAGVAVTLTQYAGMFHGFLRMTRILDQSRVLLDEVAGALRKALS